MVKENSYGAILRYTEYSNCFERILEESNEYISLFDINVRSEFSKYDQNQLKLLFSNINEEIERKMKMRYL